MKDSLQFGIVSRTRRTSRARFKTFRDPNLDAALASFGRLRQTLTQQRLRSIVSLNHAARVKQAATEASSLSWLTGYPLLVFPELFDECATTALDRARRQDQIHQRSRELLGWIQSQSTG